MPGKIVLYHASLTQIKSVEIFYNDSIFFFILYYFFCVNVSLFCSFYIETLFNVAITLNICINNFHPLRFALIYSAMEKRARRTKLWDTAPTTEALINASSLRCRARQILNAAPENQQMNKN